jgi:hypothetical protein
MRYRGQQCGGPRESVGGAKIFSAVTVFLMLLRNVNWRAASGDPARSSCGASLLFSLQNAILPDSAGATLSGYRKRKTAFNKAEVSAAAMEWPDTAGVGEFSGIARS